MTGMPINIHAFCAESLRRKHLSVLATLPGSFTSNAGTGPAVALADRDDGNIARAIDSGARLIVLDQAAETAPENLRVLLDCGIPVFPVIEVAPALARCRQIVPAEGIKLVRSSFHSPGSARNGRLEHLMALEAVLGPVEDIVLLDDTGDAYWASGRIGAGKMPVLWNGQTGAEKSRFDLDAIALGQRLEVHLADTRTASPASICLADADGIRRLRDIYESGLRLFWRSVAAEAAGQAGPAIPLARAARHLADEAAFTLKPNESVKK